MLLVPPKDALDAIVAYTPLAIELFDIKLIECTTVPWFLFFDDFIPIGWCQMIFVVMKREAY